MLCNGCGQTAHAGGCDLVEFYFYQRYGMAADRTPPPPGPLIEPETGGVSLGTPLPVEIDKSPIQDLLPKRRDTLKTKGKAKPVDGPEMIAKREEIRAARVERMKHARSFRK